MSNSNIERAKNGPWNTQHGNPGPVEATTRASNPGPHPVEGCSLCIELGRPCETLVTGSASPPLTAAQEQPRPSEQPRSLFAVECEEFSQALAVESQRMPANPSKGEAQAILSSLNRHAPVLTIDAAERLAKDMVKQGHDAGLLSAANFVEAHASKLTHEAAGLTRDVCFALAAQLRVMGGGR